MKKFVVSIRYEVEAEDEGTAKDIVADDLIHQRNKIKCLGLMAKPVEPESSWISKSIRADEIEKGMYFEIPTLDWYKVQNIKKYGTHFILITFTTDNNKIDASWIFAANDIVNVRIMKEVK